jgi:hypothetical protein
MRVLVEYCQICDLIEEICGTLSNGICENCIEEDVLQVSEEEDDFEIDEAYKRSEKTAVFNPETTHAGSSEAMRSKLATINNFRQRN